MRKFAAAAIAGLILSATMGVSASSSQEMITDGYWTQEDHFCQIERIKFPSGNYGLANVCYTVWVNPWGDYRVDREIRPGTVA
jgi:hypothetical protein